MLGVFLFWGHKICVTLNKEKGHFFTQAVSEDEDDEYDNGISMIWMIKNCTALNKERTLFSFMHRVTIRTMIPLHPTPFKISAPKCNYHSRTPLLKPVCRFVRFFAKSQKVPFAWYLELKSKISEKMLFKLRYTALFPKSASY